MNDLAIFYEMQYRALIDNMMDFIEDEEILQRIREELVRIDEGAEKKRKSDIADWWSGRSFYPTREEIDKRHEGG